MTLATYWREYHDQLVADFAQYYNVNIYEYGLDGESPRDVRWLAVLAAQLPRESRVRCAINPDLAWDATANLLHTLEFDVRSLLYAFTGGADKPKPIQRPSEVREAERKAEDTDIKAIQNMMSALGGAFHGI